MLVCVRAREAPPLVVKSFFFLRMAGEPHLHEAHRVALALWKAVQDFLKSGLTLSVGGSWPLLCKVNYMLGRPQL